ncbi:uncharacterized protein [Eurosta solidaginis]|uniref:uncharacterized protein n=1 Tax=Eurosta solidaginis TaxID=178769 RepID=UPI00353064AC
MEKSFQQKKRRRWNQEQTTGFLRCYLARKEEFKHPKKKRLAFSNVLEDMVSIGIGTAGMTPLCLEGKMRTLLHAYKAAKDYNSRTAAALSFAPYMEIMDEIFGKSTKISNNHDVDSDARTVKNEPLSPSSTCQSPLLSSPSPTPSLLRMLSPSPSPMSSVSVKLERKEIEEIEAEEEKILRRKWSREETEGFLRCYLARKEEFLQPKKKREAFSNVLKDMVSIGIGAADMTPTCLESKMRTLLHAYKAANDNIRRAGVTPYFSPYMKIMNDIFGKSPTISNTHTIHVGSRPVKKEPLSPSLTCNSPMFSSSSPPSPTSSLLHTISPSPMLPPTQNSPHISPPPSPVPSASANTTSTIRKKPSARQLYYEKKLELKKIEMEEKRKSRAEALQYFKELLKEKFERDAQIEQRKLELMEKWANK